MNVIPPQVRREAALRWRAYRSWNRACLLNAWRATRSHFGKRRAVVEVIAAGLTTMLALQLWTQDDLAVSFAKGVAASALF